MSTYVSRGKDFERGWHYVQLQITEKEEVYIGMFQDTKVKSIIVCSFYFATY